MSSLKSISLRFLKCSKILTISCFLSVFIGTILIVEMFNMSLNASASYRNSIKAMYGDCDAGITYSDYRGINDDIVNKIEAMTDVTEISTLLYSNEVQISGVIVYAIGTDNSKMVRSRYHFTKVINQGEIAINEVLAKAWNYSVGDCITIENMNFTITEIFNDRANSDSSLQMIVICKEDLKKMTYKDYSTNIVMIKADKVENLEYEIRRIDSGLNAIVFQGDEVYKDAVNSFQVFIIVLAIGVVMVTCFFTLSVFRNFLYKYKHDMALLRMMGGTSLQTAKIIKHMIVLIILTGTVMGYCASFMLNSIVISRINEQLNLINGDVKFMVLPSLLIVVAIFVILYCILSFIIRKSGNILPIEALRKNEDSKNGKIKTKRHSYRIVRADVYLAVKLITARMRENIVMLTTIALLVAIAIVGASFSTIIKSNNEKYLKSQYLAETVLTTSTSVSLADAQELYSQLKNDDSIKVSIVYNTGINAQFEGQEIEYSIADLNALSVQNIIPVKNIQDKYIIISESFARTHNLEINDYVEIKAPDTYKYGSKGYKLGIEKEGKNCTLQIACIMQDNKMMYQDAYIDIYNLDFIQESAWVNKIYINGDYQYIDNKLENMKNDFPYLKWANYSDVLMSNNRDIDNRYLMIEIVVRILVIIASIGWINSLRNIFLSRVKDYDIIRMQGVSRIRLAKIMVYQIIAYLFNGTIFGCIIGSLIVEALAYWDQNRLTFDINFSIVYQMIVIMLLFCLLLIPVIHKICNKQLLEDNR